MDASTFAPTPGPTHAALADAAERAQLPDWLIDDAGALAVAGMLLGQAACALMRLPPKQRLAALTLAQVVLAERLVRLTVRQVAQAAGVLGDALDGITVGLGDVNRGETAYRRVAEDGAVVVVAEDSAVVVGADIKVDDAWRGFAADVAASREGGA